MASLFTSISGIFLPRLGQDPSRGGGLREWITIGTYRPSPSCTPTHITLEDIWLSEIIRFINFDYERFALASWESFSVAKLEWDTKGLAGWPLLKLYYGAFFCAHSIIRGTGEGVINLDQIQTNFLEQVVSLVLGTPVRIQPGVFEFHIYEKNPGQLAIDFKPSHQAGGVHEGFWKFFSGFLDRRASNAVTLGAPDASTFIAGVTEVIQALNGNVSNSSWYSGTRNEINYQHRHGVWSPVKDRRKLQEQMNQLGATASDSIRLDYSGRKDPLATFMAISHYLCRLNSELAEFVAARSSGARSFGGSWRKLKTQF